MKIVIGVSLGCIIVERGEGIGVWIDVKFVDGGVRVRLRRRIRIHGYVRPLTKPLIRLPVHAI